MEQMTVQHEECEIHGMWLTTLIGSNYCNTTALKAACCVIFIYYQKIPVCHKQLHYLLQYLSKKIRILLSLRANCHYMHKYMIYQFHKNVNLTNRIPVFPGAG